MNQQKSKLWAIVPAAGVGQRMGANKPKQYIEINNKPILLHSLETLLSNSEIAGVQLCIGAKDAYWQALGFEHNKLLAVTNGGANRADSVLAGIEALSTHAKADDWVLVHDAARPFLSADLLQSLINELRDHPVGGILAIRMADTIKQCDESGNIVNTIPRSNVWCAQTPQMFRYGLLRDSLSAALANNIEISDESSAIEQAGYTPKVILGDSKNVKVTYPGDEFTDAN